MFKILNVYKIELVENTQPKKYTLTRKKIALIQFVRSMTPELLASEYP